MMRTIKSKKPTELAIMTGMNHDGYSSSLSEAREVVGVTGRGVEVTVYGVVTLDISSRISLFRIAQAYVALRMEPASVM